MDHTASETLTKPIPDFSRLSMADEALILKLHDDGRPQTSIADMVGCSQSTVSLVLRTFADTRLEAKRVLANGARKLAERVVNDSDVDQALEVLDRLDVAPKRQQSASGGVNILIGMPGQAIGPDITLSPVPRTEIAEFSTG